MSPPPVPGRLLCPKPPALAPLWPCNASYFALLRHPPQASFFACAIRNSADASSLKLNCVSIFFFLIQDRSRVKNQKYKSHRPFMSTEDWRLEGSRNGFEATAPEFFLLFEDFKVVGIPMVWTEMAGVPPFPTSFPAEQQPLPLLFVATTTTVSLVS